METTKLEAEVRDLRGKGPARRLRTQGKIPAVIYGSGIESTALTLDPKALVKTLQGERGRNSLFTVTFGGRTELAMVRDVDVDPVTREAVHVDFFRIDENAPVDVQIPLFTKGRAIGVVKGAKMAVKFRSLPVRCIPALIPVKIELDVTPVDVGQSITVADIKLADGVSITLRPTQAVVTVLEEKAAAVEEAAPGAPGAKAAAAKPAGKK